MSTPIAAWYADPEEPSRVRWWDGESWTDWCRQRPVESGARTPDAPAWPASVPESASVPETPVSVPETPVISDGYSHRAAPQAMPTGGISIGASLLPPLESPTPPSAPPPGMSAPPTMPRGGSSRGGALRAFLIIPVVVALCGLGFALYSRGTFDGLVGGSSRQPSKDGVTVYAGEGYSVEVPSDWTEGPTTADGDIAFLAPTEDVVQITSSHAESVAEIDLSNPATRTEMFDVLIRIMQAVRPDVQVLTRTPTDVAGAPGVKLTVAGTQPVTAQPFLSTVYLFVNDGRFFMIELTSAESGADAAVASEFEKIVASFRFD
jgi:hypothetical protein